MEKNRDENGTDELTLRELILALKHHVDFLWRKKWILIVAALIGAIVGGGQAHYSKRVYNASLTFMLNDESNSNSSGLGSILGQFGFGVPGSEYNLDKIIKIAKSRQIASRVLQDTTYSPLIGDLIIRNYDLWEEWEEDDLLNNFSYANTSLPLARDKATAILYSFLVGSTQNKGAVSVDYHNESGILTLSTTLTNEILAKNISESYYKNLASFYINQKIEKPKQTYELLTAKVDSVENVLKRVEAELAYLEDRSRTILLKADRLQIARLSRQSSVLTIMYAEILKNKETSQFILESKTPFFQLIDSPKLPLPDDEKSTVKWTVLGGIVGGALISFLLLAVNLLRSSLTPI